MKLHPEELQLARAYDISRAFEPLSGQQIHLIMERGRGLFRWYKAHPVLHNFISLGVVISILGVDGWTLLGLPRLFLSVDSPNPWGAIIVAGVIAGSIHSWLMYSMGVYSLHEGAAHEAIFVGSGRAGSVGRFIGRNLCRLGQAEPDQYAICHMAHHSKFGSDGDSEFLNFVLPRRYWQSFLPLAVIINFTDFLAHRPMTYTRSRIVSAAVSLVYNGAYAFFAYRAFGGLFTVVAFGVLLPHVGFYTDRLRQFTEHNLMPLENRSGARSFGLGFWGLFVGGGPWGQPCHLAHHLVASIPWYQQIVLHRYIKELLTPTQREQFLVAPFVGFPKLLWRIIRDANKFARAHGAPTVG